MTQRLSFSLKLTEMSSIILKVYLAFGGAEQEKDCMAISPVSFPPKYWKEFFGRNAGNKSSEQIVKEKQWMEALFFHPILSLDSWSLKMLLCFYCLQVPAQQFLPQ